MADSLKEQLRQRVVASAQRQVKGDYHQLGFTAMSTACRVNFVAPAATASACQAEILQWTADFEATYSRYLPGSVIGQINAAAGGDWLVIDPPTQHLLELCREMHAITQGIFDAAAMPLLQLWNWREHRKQLPSRQAIAAACEISGWDKVQLRGESIRLPRLGMGLDLGGIGKEYAVDQVLKLGQKYGVAPALVDFGQDVRACGKSPGKDAWYIGLEDPRQAGNCWGCAAVTNHAVATSGDYVRAFAHEGKRYGHIIDLRSGEPVANGTRGVSVIAATCTLAGVLSTAACVLGMPAAIDLVQMCQGAEACITTENGRYQTRRFANYVVE